MINSKRSLAGQCVFAVWKLHSFQREVWQGSALFSSHPQKYFIQQRNATRRKRWSSLSAWFQICDTPEVPEEEPFYIESEMGEPDNAKSLPFLNLSLDHGCEPMGATCNDTSSPVEAIVCHNFAPNSLPSILPLQFPFLQPNTEEENCSRENTILIIRS